MAPLTLRIQTAVPTEEEANTAVKMEQTILTAVEMEVEDHSAAQMEQTIQIAACQLDHHHLHLQDHCATMVHLIRHTQTAVPTEEEANTAVTMEQTILTAVETEVEDHSAAQMEQTIQTAACQLDHHHRLHLQDHCATMALQTPHIQIAAQMEVVEITVATMVPITNSAVPMEQTIQTAACQLDHLLLLQEQPPDHCATMALQTPHIQIAAQMEVVESTVAQTVQTTNIVAQTELIINNVAYPQHQNQSTYRQHVETVGLVQIVTLLTVMATTSLELPSTIRKSIKHIVTRDKQEIEI